jgi:cytochrome c
MTSIRFIGSAICFFLGASLSNADCNEELGRRVFNKCAACHSLKPATHLMGPSLNKVVGREAGVLDGFTYSVEMEELGVKWSQENLNEFLKSPMDFIPGTSMPFGGLKKTEDRDALICFLDQPK